MKKNKDWSQFALNSCIGIETGLLLSILLATMFFIGNYGWDDLEHLASSWFIFNGYAPYKDFFQHHHPLLWYMTAPVFWFVEHPIDSYRVGRVIAAIFFCGGCFLIGKIVKSLGGSARAFLYALFIYLSYPIMAGGYIQNRPDTYMVFSLLLGLYEWILFFKGRKTKNLVLCYLMFFFSFAFLQKAAWLLFPFGLYQIYLLVKKELKWSTFIKALVLPALWAIGYVGYLFFTGSLVRYWELNWVLNTHWYFGYRRGYYSPLDIFYNFFAFFILMYFIVKEKGLLRQLSLVLLGFAIIFYFMPKRYEFYWTIWTPFAATIAGLGLEKWIIETSLLKRILASGLLVLACFLTGVYIFTNALWIQDSNFEEEVILLSKQMKKNDKLVDYGDYRGHFLRNYPEHYYWFCLVRCGPLDSQLFHRHQMPDWDKFIYEQKPKYVMYHKVYDLTEADDDNTDKQIMGVDEDWLVNHYRYIDSLDTYERIDD